MRKKKLTAAHVWAMFAETEKRFNEIDKRIEEVTANVNRLTANIDKIDAKLGGVNYNANYIAISNDKFDDYYFSSTEIEYFFSLLNDKREFAGIHFDDIGHDFGSLIKMPDGSLVKDKFDIVMLNDKAAAIIKIEYIARKDNIEEMATLKAKNFRILFSNYKDFDIYLGLGAMSFEENVIEEAEKYGIGILKPVGDVIEYKTDWVRVY